MTSGEPPHITVFYTGKSKTAKELETSVDLLWKLAVGQTLTIDRAVVNTFYHEGLGRERHDVLQMLDPYSTGLLRAWRFSLATSADKSLGSLKPGDPHVTEGADYKTVEHANLKARGFNSGAYPFQVVVTGVYLD